MRCPVCLGFTAALPINDRLSLRVGYASTIDDSGVDDIDADVFFVSLSYNWADLWRGFDRLENR